jgi:hypothetical protein
LREPFAEEPRPGLPRIVVACRLQAGMCVIYYIFLGMCGAGTCGAGCRLGMCGAGWHVLWSR